MSLQGRHSTGMEKFGEGNTASRAMHLQRYLIFNYPFDSKTPYSRDECPTFGESNSQGYGKILNNGPRVFDKPSPKRRRRLSMDGRFVCAVCFVSVYNGDRMQARAYRDGERLSCRQLHVTHSDKCDHDRFHS